MTNHKLARTTKNPDVLNQLSKDKDWPVRYRVASNPNTPPKAL